MAHPPLGTTHLTPQEARRNTVALKKDEVHLHRQHPLRHGREGRKVKDGVGIEIVELNPVVVEDPAEEARRRRAKSALMEREEGDHILLTQKASGSMNTSGYYPKLGIRRRASRFDQIIEKDDN